MKSNPLVRFTTRAGWLVLFLCGVPPLSAQSFRALTPDPVPPGDYLNPAAISARGDVIAGGSYPDLMGRPWFSQAFRWTKAGGAVGLGYLPGGSGSDASAVSRKGDVIVGTAYLNPGVGPPIPTPEAYRWTEAGGMVGLGVINSYAAAVSADGGIVVGDMNIAPEEGGFLHAFWWTQATGIQDLGTLGGDDSEAGGLSADGSVVVGLSANAQSEEQVFRWTPAAGMVGLGPLPGDDICVFGTVSADGRVIIGQSLNLNVGVTHSFRWTKRRGLQDLGALSPGRSTRAVAVSGNGAVIVGAAFVGNNLRAFRWTKKEGMRAIQDILVRDCKLAPALAGWNLTDATAVSTDGRWIIGTGTDPNGNPQGWVAEIPDKR